FGPRKLIIPGTIVLVGVMIFFSNIGPSIPIWWFIVVYMILMLSISAIMMPSQTNGLNELPKHLYPHGTAIANTLQPVAGALGVSVFVSIMSQGQQSFLEKHQAASAGKQLINERMTHGVHHAYWFALALSCAAFFI
ncbi:multidrug efflux MFS transporter, partial [Klebsiella pneumoniae]|nr:multidrug efflux MFS transporter [Klebsiella pneumoniae]